MKRILTTLLLTFLLTTNVLAAEPETSETLYAKAYGYILKNNTNEAQKIFERAIKTYPDCAYLYAGMGDSFMKEGNYKKAISYYNLATKKKYATSNYKTDYYNAQLKNTSNEINLALKSMLQTINSDANIVVANNVKNILNEDYATLTFLTEEYNDNNDTDMLQAMNYKNTGKIDAAVKIYDKIITENPENFQALNNGAVILLEKKKFKYAQQYLTKALELNPNSTIILNNLAITDFYMQNYARMEQEFETAYKRNPNSTTILNNKNVAKIFTTVNIFNNNDISYLVNQTKNNPDDIYTRRTLSKIYFVKGDYKNAASTLETLYSSYNLKLYSEKAFMEYKNGNYNLALSDINNAIKLYSDNASDYEIKGRILTETGDFKQAEIEFKKALAKNKKSYKTNYFLAKLLSKQGQTAEAVYALQNYLSSEKITLPQEIAIQLLK